jgi:hypothetical protein
LVAPNDDESDVVVVEDDVDDDDTEDDSRFCDVDPESFTLATEPIDNDDDTNDDGVDNGGEELLARFICGAGTNPLELCCGTESKEAAHLATSACCSTTIVVITHFTAERGGMNQ